MNELTSTAWLIPYLVSNAVGLLLLFCAFKWQRLTRIFLALLFGGACYYNLTAAFVMPEIYLSFADYAMPFYRTFINGWFGAHIATTVFFIACAQGLIAVGMLLEGWWVRLACYGVIFFLAGIAPLGIGSAFPFSVIVSIAVIVILKRDDLGFIWKSNRRASSSGPGNRTGVGGRTAGRDRHFKSGAYTGGL